MTQEEVEAWIKKLIKINNIHAFYKSSLWIRLSHEVLDEQHNECQLCKAKGIFTSANTVHHVHYVRNCPRLALSKLDDRGDRNLIAVCESCHYDIHHREQRKGFTNPERW